MPAVSAKIYSFPLNSTLVSTESIVVPGISETIILSSLRIVFIDEDLPTFGFPIIEILGILWASSFSSSLISSNIFSTKVSMLRLCSALTATKSSNPSS